MQKAFTQNSLMVLLYSECGAQERIELLDEVNSDWGLKEEYRELKVAKSRLPRVYFKPSEQSITRILQYSKRESITARA